MCVKGGFALILIAAARKSLILNGEMSECLKERAWKAKRASDSEILRRRVNIYANSDLTFHNLSFGVRR